jgi:hypothetical protein
VCNNVYGVIYVLYGTHKGESKGVPLYATKRMVEEEIYVTHSSTPARWVSGERHTMTPAPSTENSPIQ